MRLPSGIGCRNICFLVLPLHKETSRIEEAATPETVIKLSHEVEHYASCGSSQDMIGACLASPRFAEFPMALRRMLKVSAVEGVGVP
jgi:hypothetical protein